MTSVYVLTATENEKVKECIVLPDDEVNVEFGIRNALYEIYGAGNVMRGKFEIGYIPSNIARYLSEKSIKKQEYGWIKFYESDIRLMIGKRYIVELGNVWKCCATYGHYGGGIYWKDDNGGLLVSVEYWKEL